MSASKRRAIAAKAPFLITALAVRWPKAIALKAERRRPLALHIHRQIIAASAPGIASGKVTKAELHAALRTYCHAAGYLRACKAGAARIDLSGAIAGAVTPQEAAYAADVLKARKAAKRAAKKSSPTTDQKNLPRTVAGANNDGAEFKPKRNGPYTHREASASSP